MSISSIKGKTVDVRIWAPLEEVESQALSQLRNIASLPWVFHHVAAMADCHLGKGATIGSVIAMKNAVSPSAVGVDIGCGMAAVKTNLVANDLPESLKDLRRSIESAVPVGFNSHKDTVKGVNTLPLWREFKDLTPKVQDRLGRAMVQCGTLGGGNHFIEVCLDTDDNVWVMLHSGSRNIGKTLAEIHIKCAKKLAHNQDLPDRDLAVFLAGTKEMKAYRHDLFWAQRYALENRRVMMKLVQAQIRKLFPQVTFEKPVECHHNYVAEEVHYGEDVFVTRKGAIRAGKGDLGIIPGSMGTRSYIVRGLGNEESFQSASHGAGRRMSRGAAKRQFTRDDLIAQTAGVECRKDGGVLDEIPGAYKDIDQVMANQSDLVEVVTSIKQILCVKG
jgi:tRNA-splicing ligase RtcB